MKKDFDKFADEMKKILGNLDDIDEIGDFYDDEDFDDEFDDGDIDISDFDDIMDEEFDQFEFAGISDGNLDDMHNESFNSCKNSSPLSFDGYSLAELKTLVYTPFSDESPLKINTLKEEDFAQIPMLNQVQYLMSYIANNKEIKLNKEGYLPQETARELCKISVDKITQKDKKHIAASDSYEIEMTKILAIQMEVCKEENGKMSLTQKGKILLNNPQKLLEELLITFTTKVIISRFDLHDCDIRTGQFALAFSLILVAKYGNEKREYYFYSDKYFKAFPFLQDEIAEEDIEHHAYALRTFERFMLQLGIIEPKEASPRHYQIKKTPLFDKIFSLA